MIRGTFANIRLRNQIAPGTEGGFTRDFTAGGRAGLVHLRRLAATTRPPASRWSSWPARSTAPARPATGPPRAPRCSASRPSSPSPTSASTARTSSAWASCRCSSRRAPTAESLGLTGEETFSFTGVTELNDGTTPRTVKVTTDTGVEFDAVVRIDTPGEADYYRNGGIMQYVLRNLIRK